MNKQPAYYESVRQRAARRWDQLEQDPELAGPWHQLFKQVQSPRHVLSELLQNADDAGATEASVRIENQTFIFEHNGEDFSEEHFASLCRFGYSNKRALHTIGFRGVGFKSTFSLGDRVKLFTPSLSVCFDRERFTEPRWLPECVDTHGGTRVIVEISDRHRLQEVEKNLKEWLKSPVSLLFFKNIRQMRIGDREVHWGSPGPGPVPDSKRMVLRENPGEVYLLVRSEAMDFPGEALDEIRNERTLGAEEEADFPPCRVEIVLGVKGRLYVVLPTGVETELPFACNAPFVQDPARLKIKDPETSPTNRWLLERAGTLAASAMLHWLGQTEMSAAERSRAYGLFPDVDRDDSSLEGVCGATVEEAFGEAIEGRSFLLTEDGSLAAEKRSVAIPARLFDIWPAEQTVALLDEEKRPALCRHIKPADRGKLLHWDVVDEIDREKLLEVLQSRHPPRPKTWRQLLHLWAYVAPEITGYDYYGRKDRFRIVPVQGKDVLYASGNVVRLGEKKLLQSEKDWEFLDEHLIALNQNWPRFLAEQRRGASEHDDKAETRDVESAYAVLKEIGLDSASDVSRVIARVAVKFFSRDSINSRECVHLAQIAAKLGAKVDESFRYVTSDRKPRSIENGILFDAGGGLSDLLPEQTRDSQILHPDYTADFFSCSHDDWHQWVSSGNSGLRTFVSPARSSEHIDRRDLAANLRKRDFAGDLRSHYRNPTFYIQDWDFDQAYWEHWQSLEAENSAIWRSIIERILSEKRSHWSKAMSVQISEVASNGHRRSITQSGIAPSWALKLRDLPCLPDTRGFLRKPGDLLRRTPETESLLDVEHFVDGRLDTESTRDLLDLLGVQSTPTGPDGLLDRLRALAKAESPPVHEVEKWYSRLDQLMGACSTEDFEKIKQAFRSEKIILTRNGVWEVARAVFLSAGEDDVPDAEVIRASVSNLTLWRKVEVADRPTADLVIGWLKSLPTDKALEPEESRRARSLLARYPVRIWNECGHWLNLAGEWASVDDLSYSLAMQSLIPWRHLHQWVKQQTADLQHLPAETIGDSPFSQLPPLAAHVKEQFRRDLPLSGEAATKEWLAVLGHELRRVEFDSEDDTRRVRCLADSLARTEWRETPDLEIIPYINGKPAGTSRRADVLWLNDTLYVGELSKAKQARRVPEEVGKAFGRPDIKAALDYSFERAAQDIRDYLQENFKLCPASAADDLTPKETNDESGPNTDAEEVQKPGETGDSGPEDIVEPEKDGAEDAGAGETDDKNESAANGGGEQEQPPRKEPPHQRPPTQPRPDIIALYAESRGFRKDGDNRFSRADGSWIARESGRPFPWERRTAGGDLVRCYLPKNHCLNREPLQLEADIWELIEGNPGPMRLF